MASANLAMVQSPPAPPPRSNTDLFGDPIYDLTLYGSRTTSFSLLSTPNPTSLTSKPSPLSLHSINLKLLGFISVAIIILGAFVAGARDLSFDFYNYDVVLLSNLCTAVYLTSIARLGKSSGLNTFGLMWCNGIICGPILLLSTFFQGDLQKLISFLHLSSPGFQAVMFLSCILAFFLNYTVFWNTALNSALTQTICGNLKDVFTIGLGWLLFCGLPFDLFNILGQGTGFLGSCFYAYCKLKGK